MLGRLRHVVGGARLLRVPGRCALDAAAAETATKPRGDSGWHDAVRGLQPLISHGPGAERPRNRRSMSVAVLGAHRGCLLPGLGPTQLAIWSCGSHRARAAGAGRRRHVRGQGLLRDVPALEGVFGNLANGSHLVDLQGLQGRRDALLEGRRPQGRILRQWNLQRSAKLRVVADILKHLNSLLASLPVGLLGQAVLQARHQRGKDLVEVSAIDGLHREDDGAEQLRLRAQQGHVQVLNQTRAKSAQILLQDERRRALDHRADASRSTDLYRLVVLPQGAEEGLQQRREDGRALGPIHHEGARQPEDRLGAGLAEVEIRVLQACEHDLQDPLEQRDDRLAVKLGQKTQKLDTLAAAERLQVVPCLPDAADDHGEPIWVQRLQKLADLLHTGPLRVLVIQTAEGELELRLQLREGLVALAQSQQAAPNCGTGQRPECLWFPTRRHAPIPRPRSCSANSNCMT
mmetsp:Transcript_45865/g.129952  ORF Transcript_45865/g.129952 Transcript_45865/m.129952 type:complete len:460 (+) Transcript_45865:751-2130(+)